MNTNQSKNKIEFDFKKKIILAPMAGVTDYAFRIIARDFGADYCVTEMISAVAMHYEDKKTAELATVFDDDNPIGIQIFGHDPETMRECVYNVANGVYKHRKNDNIPYAIDINMGCPVKKIVSNGDGSALMKDPSLCEKIFTSCVKGSPIPITVKMRIGWDEKHKNFIEIAKIAESCGISAITLHARTRNQMYEPGANWEAIKELKKSVKIPVIGNGDILSAEDAIRMFDETCVDSIMIGRATLGNPFIFDEIKHILNKKQYVKPTDLQKLDIAKKHIDLLIQLKGEKIGLCEARKHLAWYTKGMRFSSGARARINQVTDYNQFLDIINYLKENTNN